MKITAKKLGISEDEKMTLGNEKISKDGGSSEEVRNRLAKVQGVMFQLKKKFGRIER